VFRLVMLALSATTLVHGCDCLTPTVRQARKHADIVFRGRIRGFRDTGKGYQNVIFTVDRVWKGRVSRTFEMPALREEAACTGFWPNFLKMGRYLLVYANQFPDSTDYMTDICSRTAPVEDSKDFRELGSGHQPD